MLYSVIRKLLALFWTHFLLYCQYYQTLSLSISNLNSLIKYPLLNPYNHKILVFLSTGTNVVIGTSKDDKILDIDERIFQGVKLILEKRMQSNVGSREFRIPIAIQNS